MIEITNEQLVQQEFVDARLKNNKQVLATILGETGSGKSWSAVYLCQLTTQLYGTTFEVDDMVFSALEFVRRFKELQRTENEGIGRAILWDEIGVGLNARAAMSSENVVTTEILEMIRASRISLFSTTVAAAMQDVNLRRMNHFVMYAQVLDRTKCPMWQRNKSTVRIYKVIHPNAPGEKSEDVKTQCPRVNVTIRNNKTGELYKKAVRVPQMWLPRAEQTLINGYEQKKKAHFRLKLNSAEARLSKLEAKSQSARCEIPTATVTPTPLYTTPATPSGTPQVNAAQSTSSALQRLSGRRVA